MTSLTLYALFADDLRILAFPKKYDPLFFALSLMCLLFFAGELLMAYLSKKEYRLSFYF